MLMSQVHLLEHMTQVTLQIGLFLQTQMVQEKQKVSFLASLYAMLPAMEFLTHQSGLCMFLVAMVCFFVSLQDIAGEL